MLMLNWIVKQHVLNDAEWILKQGFSTILMLNWTVKPALIDAEWKLEANILI